MLKKLEFKQIFIDPLAVFYGIPTEDQADNLFLMFQDRAPEILQRAVELIRQDYPYKTFPNPSNIYQAMDEAQAEYSYLTRTITDEECSDCYGMGRRIVEKFDEFYHRPHKIAVPCHCPAGDRIRKAWREHDKKHKYRHAKARLTEIKEEDPY